MAATRTAPPTRLERKELDTAKVDMAIAGKTATRRSLPPLSRQLPRQSRELLFVFCSCLETSLKRLHYRSGKVVKGMQFTKKSDVDDFYKKVKDEVKMTDMTPAQAVAVSKGSRPAAAAPAAAKKGVEIIVEEKIDVELDRDAIKKFELKGQLKVCVNNPDDARITIACSHDLTKANGFSVRHLPKIDKAAWDNVRAFDLQ